MFNSKMAIIMVLPISNRRFDHHDLVQIDYDNPESTSSKKNCTESQRLKTENLSHQGQNAALSELDMEIECPRCSCVVELVFNFDHGVRK